jgi:hypothetical protein
MMTMRCECFFAMVKCNLSVYLSMYLSICVTGGGGSYFAFAFAGCLAEFLVFKFWIYRRGGGDLYGR